MPQADKPLTGRRLASARRTQPNASGLRPRGSTTSPARACAYAVVRRVFEHGAYADRALHAEAARLGLPSRDRALATRLAYGTVQRRATLDHVIAALAGRPVSRLEPAVLAALRLGVFQLAFLDRVPAHAAVGESVALVKPDSPRGAGLVNAVLRRAGREARALIAALPEATPAEAALRHSHPEWIAELWFATLGPEAARALMAAGNEPAEAALRANTLRIDAAELAGRLPVPSHPADRLPEGLVLDAPFDAFASPLWEQGLFMPQSRAAMAVARTLDPQPGETVLDLCAAPGGKTTHLAALMNGDGQVVAVERHPGRADALRRTAARMGASAIDVPDGGCRRPPRNVRPRPRRPTVLGPRDARRPPRRPLAQDARRAGCAGRRAAPDPRRGGRRGAPRRRARLLDVHDLARRERAARGRLPRCPHRLRRRAAAVGRAGLGPSDGGAVPADAAPPGRHGRLLHRSDAARMTDDHVDLGDVCPDCHEPWLRPTNLPGRYRCVNCMHRFELRSVCPNCGEHSTIVRMSDTALYACNHCKSSMLQPI